VVATGRISRHVARKGASNNSNRVVVHNEEVVVAVEAVCDYYEWKYSRKEKE
jgi:hypothetical protein